MQKKQKLNLDECTNNFKEDFVKSFIEDFKKETDKHLISTVWILGAFDLFNSID